jgi:penicillin-insensitive murein endopeptidase
MPRFGGRRPLAAALVAYGLLGAPGAHATSWDQIRAASPGEPASIGTPVAGCLAGGARLAPDGPGWQVVRVGRNRNWGHPRLIAYLHALAARGKTAGLPPMLIGDIGQPRGGPMPYGHRSHQIGLDVDVMFETAPPSGLRLPEREAYKPKSMLTSSGAVDHAKFGHDQVAWLRLAASSAEVDRIFVNARLKKALCAAPAATRGWLHKIRPWMGHDEHFHIRLTCAPGESECRGTPTPIPPGDGCDAELQSWLEKPLPKPAPPPARPAPPKVILPAACTALLHLP